MPIVEKQLTTTIEQPISIEIGKGLSIRADRIVPEERFGLVLFAHGAEMTRSSSGSRSIIRELEEQGLAIVAFDLLTPEEGDEEFRTGRHQRNLAKMASRYLAVAEWATSQEELRGLPIGFLGTGVSAAAALVAAAQRPAALGAVVCRNGQVDSAGDALNQVRVPTLLMVDAGDHSLVDSNESALLRLGSTRRELLVIPESSPLFGDTVQMVTAPLMTEWLGQSLILAD